MLSKPLRYVAGAAGGNYSHWHFPRRHEEGRSGLLCQCGVTVRKQYPHIFILCHYWQKCTHISTKSVFKCARVEWNHNPFFSLFFANKVAFSCYRLSSPAPIVFPSEFRHWYILQTSLRSPGMTAEAIVYNKKQHWQDRLFPQTNCPQTCMEMLCLSEMFVKLQRSGCIELILCSDKPVFVETELLSQLRVMPTELRGRRCQTQDRQHFIRGGTPLRLFGAKHYILHLKMIYVSFPRCMLWPDSESWQRENVFPENVFIFKFHCQWA